MSGYGDEPVTLSSDEWRKARKNHTCDACHEPIVPGQRYRFVKMLFDGSWDHWRRCERCQIIFDHLTDRIRAEGGHDEFCHEALDCGHDYEERWEEQPPEWLAALAFWRPGDPLPELPKKDAP